MNSLSVGADRAIAWDGAHIAVMGMRGLVDILHRQQIQTAADPDRVRGELIDDYTHHQANAVAVAATGFIDDVIQPVDTRRYLIEFLALNVNKNRPDPPRKHGNIPM